MLSLMAKIITFDSSRWMLFFAGISRENKELLTRYFKTLYPRKYVQKLISALEDENVQFKESQCTARQST